MLLLDLEPGPGGLILSSEAEVHGGPCEGLVTSYSHGQTKGVHSWKAIIFFYFETEDKRLQGVQMSIFQAGSS